ncbi:hypothetical protein JCM3770_002488 [Rhodotorula araucariae]
MPATSLLASAGFTATDAPPVPAVPAGAGLARNPSARPMPPALAQRSYTAPLPPASAPHASLARHQSVVKPDSRQWGAMGEAQRHEWLAASERVAKQTGTPLAALAFEHETEGFERSTFDGAVKWCRARWGGSERQRWATSAAVNALNARTFREQGRRRECVKDLVNDVELLFLRAGVFEDEARRRVFTSCFFEFPHCLGRLSRTKSYATAVAEALSWESDMIRKERDTVASRVRSQSVASTAPTLPPSEWDDPGSLEWPQDPAPPSVSDVPVQMPPTPEDNPHQSLTAGAGRNRRTLSHIGPHASRSNKTLNSAPRSAGREPEQDDEQPRAHSALDAYPQTSVEALRTGYVAVHGRPSLPASTAGRRLAPPAAGPETCRTPTPPFVTEATSYVSSYTSGGDGYGDGIGDGPELYEQFPYPAGSRPPRRSFVSFRAPSTPSGRAPLGTGEQAWRPPSPWQRRDDNHEEHGNGKPLGRGSRLARLFQRSLHGRRKATKNGARPPTAGQAHGEQGEMGRPPKPRGNVVSITRGHQVDSREG